MASAIVVSLQLAGARAYASGMRGATSATNNMGAAGGRAAGGIGKVGLAAAGAAVGVGALAISVGTDAVMAYQESYKIGKQTEAVIKSTGKSANVTAKQVGDLAGVLSSQTGVDDEVIQGGQNMLLTFKKVRNEAGKGNDIFNQATSTLVDMSVAMGKDPKTAAIGLGKALNDPIKGIAALSRVGVTFSESQKKTIGGLVKSGKTMEAQKMILKELNSEFGGSAKAQATNLDRLKVTWGNLMEGLGATIFPVVEKIGGALNKLGEGVLSGESLAQVGKTLAPIWEPIKTMFSTLGTAIAPLRGYFTQMMPVIKAVGLILGGALLVSVLALTTAFRIMGVGVRLFMAWNKKMVAGAVALVAGVKRAASAVSGFASSVYRSVSTTLAKVKAWGSKIGAGFVSLGKSIIDGIIQGITSAPGAVLNAVKALIPGKLRGVVGKVIPGFAVGGVTHPGGLSLVGERGPEIAAFPGGTRISPITAKPAGVGALNGVIQTAVYLNGRQIALAVGDDVADRRARR